MLKALFLPWFVILDRDEQIRSLKRRLRNAEMDRDYYRQQATS